MTPPPELPIAVDPIYGCWKWSGPLDRAGYARIWKGERTPKLAHRWLYEQLVAPIAAGLELDHECRRRDCVRPEHMAQVTRRENVQRCSWRNRAGQQQCRRGHGRDRLRRTPEGGMVCRSCCGLDETSPTLESKNP